MKLKQKAFQELVQMMKLRENQEKSRYRTRMHNKNSVCVERNNPTPKPLGYRAIDFT